MLVNNKHNDSGIFRTNKRGLGVYYLPIVEVCIKKRYFLGTKFQNRIKYFCLVIWQKSQCFWLGTQKSQIRRITVFSQYRLKYYYYYSWPVTFREKTLDKVCSRTTKKNNDKRFSTLVFFFADHNSFQKVLGIWVSLRGKTLLSAALVFSGLGRGLHCHYHCCGCHTLCQVQKL